MKYGLIGEKLGHSFSKEIHEMIGYYNYEIHEVAKTDIDHFMKEKNFIGINVTIPYKETVIPYLDEIDNVALRIGAVNTIINVDGKLKGFNTDYYGMKALINKADIDCYNKKVLILGTGGTSKTAYALAEDLGAKIILKVSINNEEGTITYDEAISIHNDADVIINTTPVGMYPKNEGCIIDLKHFKSLSGVVDVVYNPLRTVLVQNAKDLNIKATAGLYMLVGQAVYASGILLKLIPAFLIILASSLTVIEASISARPLTAVWSSLSASNFFAVQGITDTLTISLGSILFFSA